MSESAPEQPSLPDQGAANSGLSAGTSGPLPGQEGAPDNAATAAPAQGTAADTGQAMGGQPAAVDTGTNPETGQPQPVRGTANESPAMPPNAQAGAAKAHAILGHLVKVAQAAQSEIERYVPAELLQMAERDAQMLVRSAL